MAHNVDELPIETFVDLSIKSTMEFVSFFAAMRASLSFRSPDLYNPLQIFLQETGSQEIMLFMVQSAVGSVFIMNYSYLFATCDWFDLSPFTSDLS